MEKINIAIVDDQTMLVDGLVYMLHYHRSFEVTQKATSGQQLISKIENSDKKPHVVIMDIHMPEMDGFETTQRLHKILPQAKVIYLTTYDNQAYVEKAINNNASAFISKSTPGDYFIQVIREVFETGIHQNEFFNIDTISKALTNKPRALGIDLSSQEIVFVRLLCHEMKMEEIAVKMKISLNTAKTYKKRIMAKINAKKDAGIVSYAIKNGLF